MNNPDVVQSEIIPKKPFPWWILLPIVTAVIIISMSTLALVQVGPKITIEFPDGHGIKVGDALKHRGIVAGEVTDVALNANTKSISVEVRLEKDAHFLARKGSRFWIVRPTLSISQISGADTIIGARYIAVAPGSGLKQLDFIGLETEPPILNREPNGLEIICQAHFRSGLRAGAPVLYRQFVIGRVVSVDLASDASAIEARLYINADYTGLIRDNTVFWNASGFTFSGGIIGGLQLTVDSIETLLSGGVALAVPSKPGRQAKNGQRFTMHATAEEDWLKWSPSIEVFKQQTRIHASDIPNVLAATSQWQEKGFWGNKQLRRQGFLIYTNNGLLGLNTLLQPKNDTAELVIDKHKQSLGSILWQNENLALIKTQVPRIPWPKNRFRFADQPEDAYVILDGTRNKHLPVARFKIVDGQWRYEQNGVLDKSWHGAPVIAKSDKQLIGFLSADDYHIAVIPLPKTLSDQLD